MKKIKYMISILSILIFCFAGSVTSFALQLPDKTRIGSIRITMSEAGKTVPGGSFTVFHVGELAEDDGNYSFAYTEEWNTCPVSLEDIQSSKLPEDLLNYTEGKESATKRIDNKGYVEFINLKTGLYLFVQKEAADGYERVKPFIVSLPIKDVEDWKYDVDATPKVQLEKEPELGATATSPDSILPQTGQLNWPIPILAISGILLFSCGWYLYFIKRENAHEK